MKVCHITTVHKASDERIYIKECASLAKKGFEVSLIAPSVDGFIPENINYIACPDYKNRFVRLFIGSIHILILSLKNSSALYHFHDPELMWVGSVLRVFGKKVIYDVHEDLPKQVLYKDWISASWIRKMASWIIMILEKCNTLFYNGIVAATEDIARKFPERKTIILRNYPLVSMISGNEKSAGKGQEITLVYAGGISRIRGIEIILSALSLLKGKVKLTLLGQFESDELFEKCRQSAGWKYVDYYGWIPLKEVYVHISKADIGLVTLFPVKNYLRSLPVKAFEYMAMGKPMIMSNFEYWEEIFGSCALFVDPEEAEDIVEKVNELIRDPEKANELGSNGKKLVLDEFSWENESSKLIDLYNKILKK